MASESKISIALLSAAAAAFGVVFAVFPPGITWRPWAYTFVALLLALGVLAHPFAIGFLRRRRQMVALALVFLVGGSFLAVVYYLTSVTQLPTSAAGITGERASIDSTAASHPTRATPPPSTNSSSVPLGQN